MKTSNKWLLGFVLAVFLFTLAIHGALYNEYQNGHFITAAQMHEEQFAKQAIRTPHIIVFDGTIWVNLIPADRFALELPRINVDPGAGLFQDQPAVKIKIGPPDVPAITWRQNGDTLFVKGSINQPLHRPWSPWYYRRGIPQVNIFGPTVDKILLDNGQLYLQGTADTSVKRSARLIIRNSTLWVAMQYDNNHHGPAEYFDSLDIRSANSMTIINTAAAINHLRMTLTDTSLVNDQNARLNTSVIESSPESRVEGTAGNLKKNQLIIH